MIMEAKLTKLVVGNLNPTTHIEGICQMFLSRQFPILFNTRVTHTARMPTLHELHIYPEL